MGACVFLAIQNARNNGSILELCQHIVFDTMVCVLRSTKLYGLHFLAKYSIDGINFKHHSIMSGTGEDSFRYSIRLRADTSHSLPSVDRDGASIDTC